jgi:hypothetical protein
MSGGKGAGGRLPLPAVLAAVDVRAVVVAPDCGAWPWEQLAAVHSLPGGGFGVTLRPGMTSVRSQLAVFTAAAITDQGSPGWCDVEADDGRLFRYTEIICLKRGDAGRARVCSEAAAAVNDDGSLHRELLAACDGARVT